MANPLVDRFDQTIPGGVIWTPSSPYARELCKFETTHTQYGPPGKPPYVYQEYPARLYRATRDPVTAQVKYEGFTVADVDEQRNMESRGYVAGGQGAALEALQREEQAIAVAAAERAHAERSMSERARAEAAAADDATDLHVPVVPETPIRRGPGRPRKEESDALR